MNKVRRVLQSDETGTAHVDVPVQAPHRQIEVTVAWKELAQSESAEDKLRKRQELEALAGALADDPIIRPEQPVLEFRLPVE